jgi:hypothetical protein
MAKHVCELAPSASLTLSRMVGRTFCCPLLQLGLCLALAECSALGAVDNFGKVAVDGRNPESHANLFIRGANRRSAASLVGKPSECSSLPTTFTAPVARVFVRELVITCFSGCSF